MALNNRKKVNDYEYSSERSSSSSSSSSLSSLSSSSPHLNRLAVLAAHLQDSTVSPHGTLERFHTLASAEKNRDSLTVVDNRTGKRYDIPISEGGTVKATDFKQVPICNCSLFVYSFHRQSWHTRLVFSITISWKKFIFLYQIKKGIHLYLVKLNKNRPSLSILLKYQENIHIFPLNISWKIFILFY